MKIAIIHLSDFHIKDGKNFCKNKVNAIYSALKTIGKVDEFIITFTGDLANTGNKNEYKQARHLIIELCKNVKKINNKFVNVYLIPGNHDLNLPIEPRTGDEIQKCYDKNKIDSLIGTELSYLNNFKYCTKQFNSVSNEFVKKQICEFNNYKIQFNLINTAPFSTLNPNDKELHYFPKDKYSILKREKDVDVCFTLMHHTCEWFNWNYKNDLESTIMDNSEFLLTGHDHFDKSTIVSRNESISTYVSAAGEINFVKNDSNDAFNIILIDSNTNTFNVFKFTWDCSHNIFLREIISEEKNIQKHIGNLRPKQSFIDELKRDQYNNETDFRKYFVFPKLGLNDIDDFGKTEEIKTCSELLKILKKRKHLIITGDTNYGKTTLLKYIYLSILNDYDPVLLKIENRERINTKQIIKRLFEEQYSENYSEFQKYQQLDKSKKCILIDGWDLLDERANLSNLIDVIENEFEYVIYTINKNMINSYDIIDSIKNKINEDDNTNKKYIQLDIKPFYKEKRSQLVEKICLGKGDYSEDEIENLNNYIDNFVANNIGLFSLNPAFIVKYTKYFLQNPQYDYTNCESAFSKVFEFELHQEILKHTRNNNIDEILLMLEEIAGFMYLNKRELISISDVINVINEYNMNYGLEIKPKTTLEIVTKSKIIKQYDDLSIGFINKNHLSYFIAKYLIRKNQENPANTEGIEDALNNICFGLNSDIIMFISYILNNMRIIQYISNKTETLLKEWTELNISDFNICILNNIPHKIEAPTFNDEKLVAEQREKTEELSYNNESVEVKGLFDYDVEDIDKYPYLIKRAIIYTEMICRALPAFNINIMMDQKKELVKQIYSYPRKIIYKMLYPIDENIESICDRFLSEIEQKKEIIDRDSERNNIKFIISSVSQGVMLGLFNHFAEICTNNKTIKLLLSKEILDKSEKIERLLIIENSNDSDLLLQECEKIIKSNDKFMTLMVKLIINKHLLRNTKMNFNKKQKIIDKVFGAQERKKYFLANK